MSDLVTQSSFAITTEEFSWIASLHKNSIATGFISSLGEKFLSRLYHGISKHPLSCVIVEKNNHGRLIGFISGSLSISNCYQYVITHNFVGLGLPIIFKLFSLSTIKKIFETLIYPMRKNRSNFNTQAELLSIAVTANSRGKGVGSRLVKSLEDFFKENNFSGTYKVVTAADDKSSNDFYKSVGFHFVQEFKHHNNLMNEYHKQI